MSKRMVFLLVLIFSGPLLFYLLWPSDENRLRKLFREGARAVEEKKVDEILSRVSFNYTDEHGLTYLYLKEGAARYFVRTEGIKVDYAVRNIEIRDDKASVDLDVKVVAGSGSDRGYVAGDATKPLRIKFHLEKERTKWLVVRTEGLPVWF